VTEAGGAAIGVAGGSQRCHAPPKVLGNIAILGFEGRFSKQNSAIRLKSNILTPQIPPSNFLGWLGHWVRPAAG